MADNTQISEEPTYRLTNDSEEPATQADIERLRSELNAGLSLKTSQHDFDYIVGDGKQGWTITDYIIRLEEQWHEAMSLMASKEDLADNSTTDQTKLKKLIMINESSSSDTKIALNTSGAEEIELATMDDFDKLESYFTFDWEGTWERGGLNASGATEESTSILRTASYIPSRDFTATLDNAYSFQVVRYDSNKAFIKKDAWVIGSNKLQYTTKDVAGTKYMKLLIKKNDGSNLTDVTLPKSILSVSMNGTDFTGKNNNIAMDPSVLNDVVQVSDTQPTSAINEIWVRPQGSEVEIPTMEELNAVRNDIEELQDNTSNCFSLKYSNFLSISDATDYDTLTTAGNYRVSSNSSAKTMINCPVQITHIMYVVKPISARTMQIIITAVEGPIYIRWDSSSGWKNWFSLATNNDVVPISTKLLEVSLATDRNSNRLRSIVNPASKANIFNKDDVVIGGINADGSENNNTGSYKTVNFEPIVASYIVSNFVANAALYDTNRNFINYINIPANSVVSIPSNATFARFAISKDVFDAHKDEFMISNRNYLPLFDSYKLTTTECLTVPYADQLIENFIHTTPTVNLFDKSDIAVGGIDTNGTENSSASVVKSKNYLTISQGNAVANYDCYFAFYDSNYVFLERIRAYANNSISVPSRAYYVRFIVAKNIFDAHKDELMIVAGDSVPESYIGFRYYTLDTNVKSKRSEHDISGRQFHVYRFGGDGNDWCFVRTPSNYDPYRQEPYKFIICNHGNGTTMNGSGYTATWTPRTMYLDPNDEHFNASYDMTATTDPDLQFSNPTIEKFLSEGYVVCGCENYADGCYGNNNCRNACVDFFEHMVKSYNVHNYCYMIGASNGAMTSINAAYLLKEKVRAMVLQYPLTCLVNQYFSYEGHQSPIRNAYGITAESLTENELIEATLTHDVLHWEKGDSLNGYFPPVKIYYSRGDTVVSATANSLPLISLLENSYKIVESVECTGNHGHLSHFDPVGFYEFLSRY